MFLEEFKYTVKDKNMIRYIIDDLKSSTDDSDKKNCDKED